MKHFNATVVTPRVEGDKKIAEAGRNDSGSFFVFIILLVIIAIGVFLVRKK